jgi:long-chain acyl-CoA synthetase
MTLGDVLAHSAERHPERPAATDLRSGRGLRYAELAAEAETVGRFLRAQGVRPGMRVALAAPNALFYLPAAFGILRAGACLIPIPAGATDSEQRAILRLIDVNGCLLAPGEPAPPLEEGTEEAVIGEGTCAGFCFRWARREAEAPSGFRETDPAFVRFTSGTTAERKGVILSHQATLERVAAASQVLGLEAEDRILWVLPLAFHFAVTITAYLRAGAHVLLCPDTLPAKLLAALHHERATLLYASPLHFERLSNLKAEGGLEALRLALSTTAPLPGPVAARMEEVHGVPVGQAYGIIEAGLPCINTRTDGVPATSVGRAVPGYEVAVFSDDGQPSRAGESGEVGVRGPGLFSGYYSPWLPFEQVARGGFFPTGDVGRLDEQGALHLLGRRKSMVFVAGMKVFPEEIEACLNAFPGVRESRVFGRPHPRLGEVPCAELALDVPASRFDLDALRVHCARELSPYRAPVEFLLVDAVARSAGGKILRH